MKYLAFESLENINNQLSCVDSGDTRIFGRIEAYSCKNTEDDKRLKKHVQTNYPDAQMGLGLTPASMSPLSPSSSSGPLSQTICRKTLFYLLATLNAAYPDYDFSDVKPESFTRVPTLGMVANNVNTTLLVHLGVTPSSVGSIIWAAIDEAAQLSDCEIYSFHPDADSEPDAEEGNLWSFYFFFFNRKLKRVVFFTARAVSFLAPMQPEERNSIYMSPDADVSLDDVSMGGEHDRGLSYEQYTMSQLEIDV
ncbi:RNA polymerase III-inhibiting protein maf1 [Borealophlyctis nickersoniae]|nr:RNA polymerase III-inhibiting protein maf1 [Borealophlyctis nickersoniae]